jgi:hypothetical protein
MITTSNLLYLVAISLIFASFTNFLLFACGNPSLGGFTDRRIFSLVGKYIHEKAVEEIKKGGIFWKTFTCSFCFGAWIAILGYSSLCYFGLLEFRSWIHFTANLLAYISLTYFWNLVIIKIDE